MVFWSPWRLLLVSTGVKEGKPRTEVIQNEIGRQRRKTLVQRLTEQRLKRCFCILDLRQGTILIALVELIALLFFGIMVSMVLLHVLEIEALIISEVEDSPARESIALSGLSGQEAIIAEVNNESRLQVGLNLAAYKVLGISCVLMSVFLHLIASVLLLLGAILRKRGLLIMWFCTTTTDLSVIICGMIVAVAEVVFRGDRKLCLGIDVFVAVGVFCAACILHNMLIVGSLYWELFEMRQRVRSTNVIGNLHINIRPDWSLDADVEMLGESATAADAVDGAGAAAVDGAVAAAVNTASSLGATERDANATEHDDNIQDEPLIPNLLPASQCAQIIRDFKQHNRNATS